MKRNKYYSAIFILVYVMFNCCIFRGSLLADKEKQAGTIEPQEYKAEALRDPFQSYLVKEEKKAIVEKTVESGIQNLPPLTVQGIIWGGKVPQAIINNKVVKAGDIIEEVKITDITNNGVTVSFAGQQYNLSTPAQSGQSKKSEGGINEKYF